MKTISKLQIVVFGLDQTGKPQAGRFSGDQADVARQAATTLKLQERDIGPELEEIAKKVPMGRIHARGKAFIPYVKRELYDQLTALPAKPGSGNEEGTAGAEKPAELSLAAAKATLAATLPVDWESIAPGQLVLVQESLQDGWWEAVVIARDNESLTLRLRDFPKYPTYRRHIRSVALVHPGLT